MHPQEQPLKILFVCSRNQWRSPTAETVWGRRPDIDARSAGTSPRARHTISTNDIRWADLIMVMENKHRDRILAKFTRLVQYKAIHVLEIPDEYNYMAPALVAELEQRVAALLDLDE